MTGEQEIGESVVGVRFTTRPSHCSATNFPPTNSSFPFSSVCMLQSLIIKQLFLRSFALTLHNLVLKVIVKKNGLQHKISQTPARSHFHFPSNVLIFIVCVFTVSAPCIQIVFSFLSWTSCRLVTANHIYHKLRVFKSKPRKLIH